MTEPQMGGTYEQLLAAARWAEEAGLVAFARSDHYYWDREPAPAATDAFATIAGLARETRRIRLCVLVTPVTFRHPAVIAKTAATIDEMSGGRFDLGIGTGWFDIEHDAFGLPFPAWSERFGRLEETLVYVQTAFREGHGSFSGRYYELDADVRPTPIDRLPIIVGGQGRYKTPRLAGTFADEYNHPVGPASEIAPKIARVRSAALEAGRAPGAITMSVMGRALVGLNEQEYRRKLAEAAGRRGESAEELEIRWSARGIPIGPPERVADTLAGLAEAGVSKFYVQHFDLADLAGLESTFTALRG